MGKGGGVGGFSPTSPKILISKTAAHQNNQSGNAFGKSKASTNIILFTNNNNNVANGFGGNGAVNFTQINANQPKSNNINAINNQMIPSAINQRNIVNSVVSFGNPTGNLTGPVTSNVQSFESSYQQQNVNLKGVLSTNSFVNPTTYFATGQSPVSAQTTQAVLSQIGVNSAYQQQQQKIQSNKFTNNQAYPGTQGPSQNQVIGSGPSNAENMKPTRIFIIDSYQDGGGQGTSSINQNHLLKEANRTNGGGSFNDQSQQIKGIFQGSGTAALQNQARVTVQTQNNNGGVSKMKTHYPNNEINSLGQNKHHMNQLTPKATHENTLVTRHTMGGASSQMSTIHNSNNIIGVGNDLISGNSQIAQTQSANNYNSKKGSKLQHHNRLILQGGQDIITGSTVSSSTPNGMQNHIMLAGVGPVAKTQYNGIMGNKNFGDLDEKRRNKQDLQLNEIIGVKKQVSVDCSSILDQRLAYNQGNNSPTIILKTTIAEQTTQHSQPQQRIRSFNYKTSSTYDHYSYDPVDHQNTGGIGGLGSTVLQSDDSFRRLHHGGVGQNNSHTQQLLPRPGVRMSLTKESNRQPILKQDRQYHNNPQTLIGAIIEGSSIQQSVKQHFSQTSNEKLKKANANMNRKHLIHQRIKCQGIPVVHNATQYNNQGYGVAGSSWATAPGTSAENTSSTHFSNFRSTNYGAGSEGIPSGKNSLSSGGIMSEHMKNGNTFSKMDASIFNSIAQTKEFQELAQTLSQISQNYQNGFNKHQQIFDQEETLQMIKNYSSILMKDTKFRDNVLLAANAHQGTNHTLKDQGGATPYIQYLIKNFKTRAIDYSGSKFGKYYHHNTNKLGSDGELVNHNTSTAIGEQDYDNQGSLTRLHINNQRTQGGARSQTSLDKMNSDQKYSMGKQQQQQSDQEGRDTEAMNAALNQSQYAQSLRVKRYQTKNSTTNAAADNTSSQENLHSPYKDQQSDSQRNLNNQNQKSSQKLIQSLKRYASKERFQKLLDEIASTAMKESVDLEGNELFQQRLWEASQWLIQEQLKQRHNGRPSASKNLKGTNSVSGTRQVSTPTYGDRRSLNGQDSRIKDQSFTMLPMKIQQIQRIMVQPQPPTIQEIMDDDILTASHIQQFQQKNSSQNVHQKMITPQVKKIVAQKAPLVPTKPKVRLDSLLLANPTQIQMPEVNELFSQINRFLMMTIKHKDAYSNLQLQEIKYQSLSLGLKLTNQDLQLGFLKSNNFVSMLRSKVSALVNKFIIPSFPGQHGIVSLAKTLYGNQNQLGGQPVVQFNSNSNKSIFKFWVENSGNNHQLVKQTCKKRTWMILSTDYVPPVYGPGQGKSAQIDPKPEPIPNDDPDAEEAKQITTAGGPHLIWTQLRRPKIMRELTIDQLYNHIDGINLIATKTGLFQILKRYYEERGQNVFDVVPDTYIINLEQSKVGQTIGEQKALKEKQIDDFARAAGNHIWILKPGENTNRGHGIQIFDDLRKIIHSINHEYTGQYKTVILQKYIPNPYLISKRKFDFRVYGLLTYNYLPQIGVTNQPLKLLRGYFYEEGYLRTSCKEFNLKQIHNKYVHLTNDAVQKYSQDYGKFENGNKVSYEDFRTLMLKEKNIDFNETVLPQIKQRIREVFEASGPNLIGEIRWDYNGFELMGFDFMLDDDLKLYLIECNTNPCLETQQSILLQRLIPQVLDQTCKLAVDPFLRASEQQYTNAPEISLSEFRYEMVYEHKFPSKFQNVPSPQTATEDKVNEINEEEEEEEPPNIQEEENGNYENGMMCNIDTFNQQQDDDANIDND